MPSQTPFRLLTRELGVMGAVLLGLGSIVGTGVYVGLGLAAGIAGPALVLAIPIAGALALCNGLSSAQLAASHPVSGGTYEYGHVYLHPLAGFIAGWLFLCAKSASAATAAMAVGGYAASALGIGAFGSAVAVGVVLLVTAVILLGLRPAKWINGILVAVAVGALVVLVGFALPASLRHGGAHFTPFMPASGARGVLYAAALVFVAYTGYGRVATLGEEVRDPARTIPRAIFVTLLCALLLYLAVAVIAIGTLGAQGFAYSATSIGAPLEAVALNLTKTGTRVPLRALVALGALAALTSVLLNLLLGLSRVYLAMGRRGDLPPVLALLNGQGTTPVWAVLLTGCIVATLAAFGDIRSAWTFSAFTVLLYYALTNLAALRLPASARRFPHWVSMLGLAGCLGLAVWIPMKIWGLGFVILAAGLLLRFVGRRVWL